MHGCFPPQAFTNKAIHQLWALICERWPGSLTVGPVHRRLLVQFRCPLLCVSVHVADICLFVAWFLTPLDAHTCSRFTREPLNYLFCNVCLVLIRQYKCVTAVRSQHTTAPARSLHVIVGLVECNTAAIFWPEPGLHITKHGLKPKL